ncbi:tRNA (N6-threonylcarbamoyladenosine(37)-N6)-methyltransferase TrmO [Salinarimonas ramus]|uniref:tRNA (N6-threonylcarbamoyladenosine(37)-N6)-methyltransferase TrmO n=1 Tax=Salinarimonas ramus TaxID=690164 RepID=A0A917QDN1_9HYPH|nr:tRNA (N6-threonylcarbamoyladenosine(37)-N6)-methyltransferase TrmO [Salinarimonas ramus]GGK45584.1 tRNA (N6-threonylcarbamoyladenosine(37)-N6)-methyltransferase TrmO [Salinarimonas ramus]
MDETDDAAHGRRPGEIAIDLPATTDAGVHFIGRIRTPWADRDACPKNPAGSDAACTIELDARYEAGLADLDTCTYVIVLYWMDRAPRNLVVQTPRSHGRPRGVFALRSPARPNPIALSVARLERIEGKQVVVRGLDCVDGTPLLDLKPYFPSIDSRPDARVGWRETAESDDCGNS